MAKKKGISAKSKIVKDYASLAKKLDRPVQMKDLVDIGHTKDKVTYYFQNLARLEEVARNKYPEHFPDVAVESLIAPKRMQKMQGVLETKKRFVVTTAVMNCPVDQNFLASIKTYCRKNDAALLVLTVEDPAKRNQQKGLGFIDKALSKEHIIIRDTALNSNLYISSIKLSAKHIDPITGLGRIGQRNGSFIYASPKQRYQAIPVSNNKLPHVLMTTGAITKADYGSDRYLSLRTAYIATNDHVMGALIVEVEDNKIFHVRQIQADKKGTFIDLGTKYAPSFTSVEVPEAFVLGDWHSGETSPTAAKAWYEVATLLKPKRIVLHDLFNGMSINHHERNSLLLRSQRADHGQLDLRSEFKQVANDLNELSKYCETLVVTKSNHDEFLDRYLEEGIYVKDPMNKRIALELALAKLDGYDPLRYAVEMAGLEKSSKIRWLERDEDLKIARVQLAEHGDKGANGAKGSLRAIENAYGQAIVGHSHTPGILRGVWQVGTSSELRLNYTVGASSWAHASVLLYANGSRQMILSIEGKWRMEDKKEEESGN